MKKHNPNSIMFKFTVNGVPVITKDDTEQWHIFQDIDTHFDSDPKDVFHTKTEKQNTKLTGIAESANKGIQSVMKALNKK